MVKSRDDDKLAAAKTAVAMIKANDIVGLGTGSTATFAIKELAKLVSSGLKISGVPTSKKTDELARSLGIPMLALEEVVEIDISIDGADEFTTRLELIKGGGGALFREKIVASLSKNRIIIADATKKVDRLGAFTVPVEVVPVAQQYVFGQLATLGGKGKLRKTDEKVFVTDNQNHIIDVDFGLIDSPAALAISLNQIEGVLAHGLFIGLTTRLIMSGDGKQVIYMMP
jgi:ribose 5-phosphate isomerase A